MLRLKRLLVPVIATIMSISGQFAMAEEQLVIYSGRSDQFVLPVVEAFTEKTGIKVILHNAKSTALLNKLILEGKRTEADLFLSNDAGNLQVGADKGLFEPLSDEFAAAIPEQYRAPDNAWIGLSSRMRVLVVNTNAENTDAIQSVFDLANPALKGRLAITHSANGSYIAGVTVYMLASGEKLTGDWLRGMKKNVDGKVFNKHSKVVNAVAAGKADVGLVNHYYIYRHLAKTPDAPIKIVLPDQDENGMGVAENVAGIAISQYSKNKEAAKKLVAFLISEEGQKIFAEVNREYPVRPGVAAAPAIPTVGSFKVSDVSMHKLGTERNRTLDLIESIGMP